MAAVSHGSQNIKLRAHILNLELKMKVKIEIMPDFETTKPTPNGTLSPASSHLLQELYQLGTHYSMIGLGGAFSFKTPQHMYTP